MTCWLYLSICLKLYTLIVITLNTVNVIFIMDFYFLDMPWVYTGFRKYEWVSGVYLCIYLVKILLICTYLFILWMWWLVDYSCCNVWASFLFKFKRSMNLLNWSLGPYVLFGSSGSNRNKPFLVFTRDRTVYSQFFIKLSPQPVTIILSNVRPQC